MGHQITNHHYMGGTCLLVPPSTKSSASFLDDLELIADCKLSKSSKTSNSTSSKPLLQVLIYYPHECLTIHIYWFLNSILRCSTHLYVSKHLPRPILNTLDSSSITTTCINININLITILSTTYKPNPGFATHQQRNKGLDCSLRNAAQDPPTRQCSSKNHYIYTTNAQYNTISSNIKKEMLQWVSFLNEL